MNNQIFILSFFTLLTIVALSIITIYNYICCITLKRIYDELLFKEKSRQSNKKTSSKINNDKNELILESKYLTEPKKTSYATIKRTVKQNTKNFNNKKLI